MNESFKTLALLLATISAVLITATDSNANPGSIIGGEITQVNENDKEKTRNKLLCLAFECARLVEYLPRAIEYAPGTQRNIINHYLGLIGRDVAQQLPDTHEARRLVNTEINVRFYKCLYNSICTGKQSNWIMPPKILRMLPVPHDLKKHEWEVNEPFVRANALENGLIKPMTPWFPADAKIKIEQFVQSLTEQEKIFFLCAHYVSVYRIYSADTDGYRKVYNEVRKKLAESDSPEELALFKQLYTPAVYEDTLKLIQFSFIGVR